MSDQKLVSPLLDGFIMGDPMNSHDGVCCCPAMKENSDEKYIVRIISIPASQKQLDALLLTGAYKDAAAAMEYFKELTDGVVQEAELLQRLSKLDGFLPFEGWQVVPMEDNQLGYKVYLLSPYKRTLEKFLRRNNMTHLGAINLGLDLCAALAICRRAGYMFVNLKPTNIFITGEKQYRIGDLGFMKLSSMKYTSLPSKYRSSYTPPELHDALATLNPTADTYALGMILYKLYNNGVLPFEGKAPNRALPAPLNADYELAEIILKACAPNPRNRYQTPIEMGQALVSYMQRNTVNDTPIVPPAATPVVPDPEDAAAPSTKSPAGADLSNPASDETVPSEETGSDLTSAGVTDEGIDLLSHADELLAEPAPEPDPQPAPDDDDADLASLIDKGPDISDVQEAEADDEDDDAPPVRIRERRERKKRRFPVGMLVFSLILALLLGGGAYYYKNYYLLNINSLEIEGSKDTITVQLSTDVDESLLTAICTDTYGNRKTQPVRNGQAVFTELNPGTQYNITLEVSGFHALSGSTTGKYSTQEQTDIIDFTSKTGTEDGSVILNFTVEGPESQDWIVEYATEGEETKSISFTGHMVTVTGLTVGKTYTFRLLPPPGTDLYLVGNNTLEVLASKIVVAQNLAIVSCIDGVLTTQWSAPADTAVESWSVRCYAEAGYDETVTVTEPTAQFSNITPGTAYTVEVLAAGMTQSARTYVTANPITISDFKVEPDSPALNISWNFAGTAPEGGWLLMYSIDNNEAYEVIKCSENKASIERCIPKSVYHFTLQAADGSTVFGGVQSYTCPKAPDFNAHALSASKIQVNMCKTPNKEGWIYKDVSKDDYTTEFSLGDKVSLILYGTTNFRNDNDDTSIMFLIRDSDGNVLTELLRTQTKSWRAMWGKRYCTLDIPVVPNAGGKYTVEVYFDNAFVLSQEFTINVG